MRIVLPESKTYLPGPGRCIYCPPDRPTLDDLRREHIIPRNLGGQLVLHTASCRDCENLVNKEIETPALARMWLAPRTHLGLRTSQKRETLRIGRWKDTGEMWPPDMGEVDFRFDEISLDTHPMSIILLRLFPPGILWNEAPTEKISHWGFDAYIDAKPNLISEPGQRTADFQPFSPEVMCRSIAKIAHGAAVAELGLNAFTPLLPDVIMRRSRFVSHLVGSSLGKGRQRSALHEIMLTVKRGYIVASVQLFAKFGLRPFHAVVGRASDDLIRWNSSALLTASTPSQ